MIAVEGFASHRRSILYYWNIIQLSKWNDNINQKLRGKNQTNAQKSGVIWEGCKIKRHLHFQTFWINDPGHAWQVEISEKTETVLIWHVQTENVNQAEHIPCILHIVKIQQTGSRYCYCMFWYKSRFVLYGASNINHRNVILYFGNDLFLKVHLYNTVFSCIYSVITVYIYFKLFLPGKLCFCSLERQLKEFLFRFFIVQYLTETLPYVNWNIYLLVFILQILVRYLVGFQETTETKTLWN